MLKKMLAVLAVVVLIVAGFVATVPACRNTVVGWFSNQTVEESTNPTNPTEGAESTEPTVLPEKAEEVLKRSFTFEEFVKLATTDGMWNVAPEDAVIFDLTGDEFVVESEEEQKELAAVMLRVNSYGAMSIMQVGFENKENHVGETVAPVFTLCNCKLHKESFNPDMGQFHWYVAEGNQALGAKSWTRMTGEMQEVLMNFEVREMIRTVACYWFVENEAGEQEINFGIRVCGDQKEPEPPVEETPEDTQPPTEEPPEKPGEGDGGEQPPAVQEFTVSYSFVGTKGESLPEEVMNMLPSSIVVREGTIVTPKNVSNAEIQVSSGTWKFQGWDKESATVNSDVTFIGTWKFVEQLTLAEPVEDYAVSFRFTAYSGTLPESVNGLCPNAIVARKGDTVVAPAVKPIVEVSGGAWVFRGWTSDSITVVGDATITGLWTFEKDPEPEHTPTVDEDPNPVANNQQELNGLGDRTDEVPEDNTPVHSERGEDLSLLPVVEEEENDDQPAEGMHTPTINDVDEESESEGLTLSLEAPIDDVDEESESDALTLSLDLPGDDSEVADQETQDALNAMFGNRE